MMAITNITIQFIMVVGRKRCDLDLHYVTMIEAELAFYSNAMGGSWAIARCLFHCRVFRNNGDMDETR